MSVLSGWDQVVLEEIMYIFTDIKATWCDKQNRHYREFKESRRDNEELAEQC